MERGRGAQLRTGAAAVRTSTGTRKGGAGVRLNLTFILGLWERFYCAVVVTSLTEENFQSHGIFMTLIPDLRSTFFN